MDDKAVAQTTRPDYGIDAPGIVRNLLIIGLALLIGADFVSDYHHHISIDGVFFFVGYLACTGAICILMAVLMLRYAKKGKFAHRDRILALYEWKGNEKVLDVGTGLGLLMIGAAKKLTTGRSTGIDIWNKEDLSNNTIDRTKRNAALEGVTDKIDILSENIVKTGFPDGSFDVIVSNLCLHNIKDKTQRKTACAEIYRLLKGNGVAIISDFKNTGDYAKTFSELGMTVEKCGTYYLDTYPWLTIIRVVKQAN